VTSLITLAIWAAVIGGALFAVDTAWKKIVVAPIETQSKTEQRAADQLVVDATAADRDTWKAGKVACDASVEKFKGLAADADKACKDIRTTAATRQAATQAVIDKHRESDPTYAADSAKLLEFVQSKVTRKAPPDELKDTEHYLDDALDSRVR
jgi:hypothetical protein